MRPRLIEFQQKGNDGEGFLSIATFETIPFTIKRVFWAYATPENVMRGHHAHKNTEMILVAVSGEITVNCEIKPGYKKQFLLNNPNIGLYIPVMCWHTMTYTQNTVQLVLVNTHYDEDDYIRDYYHFQNN